MRVLVAMALAAAILGAPSGYSVEPAYRGQFGNNEEPATRPYKWLYRGVKSLFYHTAEQFIDGNMRTPVIGSAQGLRGLRRGTVELGESLYRGGVYAPAPPRNHYKSMGTANAFVEQDLFARNSSDFLFSWYFFPAQKFVDRYPVEGDRKVDIRKREARETRLARTDAAKSREVVDPQGSRVKEAQRGYIGSRADYGTQKTANGYGNLMKLAR